MLIYLFLLFLSLVELSFGFRSREYIITEGRRRSYELEVVKSPSIRLASIVQLQVLALNETEAQAAMAGDVNTLSGSIVPAGSYELHTVLYVKV